MGKAWQIAGFTRRAIVLALSTAALVPFAKSAALEHATDAMGDVDPLLMQAICAHCAAYSDVGRLARKADAADSGSAVSTEDTGALNLAIDVERQLLMSVCAYPAHNDAERHDKATYLLGIFDGDEPSGEHVTALLTSMKMGALAHSPGNLPPVRTA
ncbi:hypothetical protein [Mesorhizobium sp. M0715]|uniref:hypothetical protein n=1 Tax=Mesorhizobium sp. M0715 TaxID=2956990 RepID=UPI003335C9E6